MGAHHRRNSPLLPLLALLAAASAATLQPQPQALVPGYGKEFQPFGNYNGIPIAPRPSPWIRAAEIQSANAQVYRGEGQRPAFSLQPQYPVLPAPREQQAPPADVFIYQEAGPLPPVPRPYSSGSSGDQGPQTYEHSMLLIDHPPEQMMPEQRQPEQRAVFRSGSSGDQGPQTYEHSMLLIDHPPGQMMPEQRQPEQRAVFRSGNSGDQGPQTYEHSMLLIDHPPEQMMPQQGHPEQQAIITSDDSDDVKPVQYEHSMLELDHPADEAPQQQQDQQPAMSGSPVPAESPVEETVQVQVAPADQQTSAQESGVATAQVTQQDSSVPQGPMFMPYQQGPRPFGVIFQSNEPYPGLRPPAYQLEQVAWGVQPGQVPVYPAAFREQPPQQEQQPIMSPVFERPLPAAYYPDDFQVKGGYQPFLNQRRAFDARPVVEDRLGTVPRPPGGVAPFPMVPSYVPETPLEETAQPEVVPDKNEQSETRETEKSKDDDAKDDDDEDSDEIENKVKALKDAADVEEEVVPALVVFLKKKGHKAFHDKDSVGIPGKEDRFRRSPSSGSGSSSHSSSSSSSSSGPVYFGDGGSGSYSSSSSQSSASSSSGGGAPLGLGASGPGVGGGGAFYGGGHVPPSGYGVSGVGGVGGGGYGNSGYGNTGYGNTGYGNSGYGGGAGGGGSYGGGYGGVGGGVGPSGGGGSYGGGCTTCGEDSNVLLNRFGEVEGGGGPFTVGGSGVSKGQGVHSSASSSIDSTGKVTYTAFAGKH